MKTRKNIRLDGFDYNGSEYYFITICCYKRRSLLGEIIDGSMFLSKIGNMISEEIRNLHSYHNTYVDTKVIMPNHIHFILDISEVFLPQVIQLFKSECQKKYKYLHPDSKLWQRGYYEHIIRNERSLTALRKYILNNPVKWEVDSENPKYQD